MPDFYVLQMLKVGSRTHYIIRGLVEDVPAGVTAKVVAQTIDAAGQAPNEAGIVWANHTVRIVDRAPETDPGPEPWVWNWERLVAAGAKPVLRQLNVRIPATLYRDCEGAALAGGLNMRAWVQAALENELNRRRGSDMEAANMD